MSKRLAVGLFWTVALLLGAALPGHAREATTQDILAQAAPIPPAARGPAIDPAKGYLVQEISGGLYWVTDGLYQVIFLTTGQGVIAVDAPPTLGERLLAAIRETTNEPITHVIYSHAHVDHIGSAAMFPSNVTIIAHDETAALLRRANDPRRPIPSVTFSSAHVLEVGSQRLELSYRGPIHEPGNIFIYAPRQKVLNVVDIVFPGWVPFKQLAVATDVPAFVQAHDDILGFDFDVFVGGHVSRLGTRQDVEIQKQYINDVRANAMYALQTVDFMAIGQRVGFENPWVLFDTYLGEVARVCAERTIPNWIDRLAGADVFTMSHCAVFGDSLRID